MQWPGAGQADARGKKLPHSVGWQGWVPPGHWRCRERRRSRCSVCHCSHSCQRRTVSSCTHPAGHLHRHVVLRHKVLLLLHVPARGRAVSREPEVVESNDPRLSQCVGRAPPGMGSTPGATVISAMHAGEVRALTCTRISSARGSPARRISSSLHPIPFSSALIHTRILLQYECKSHRRKI